MTIQVFGRHNLPIEYYVYLYLREDNTPYYVGMGKGLRAWASHKQQKTQLLPSDATKIHIIAHRLSKEEAGLLEIKIISYYGRVSVDGGLLCNISSGGAGSNKFQLNKEQCETRRRNSLKNWQNEEYRNKVIDATKRGTNTEEAKKKYSDAHKKQWEEKREIIIAAQREAHKRPEVRENKSRTTAAMWKNEDFIKKMTVECEHCGMISKAKGAYVRWHGDRCKNKGKQNEY